MKGPNQLLEANRRQSARFGLAREGGPVQHCFEGSVRRSPQQQRSVMTWSASATVMLFDGLDGL